MRKNTFGVLWAWGLTALTLLMGNAAYAGPPFTCDGNIYQVQSGQLRIFDPITSSYINVGPQNGSYNATGYNVLDNYAYASQGDWLIRISSDGTIEQVHNIGFGSFSGDVDYSNNFWLRRTNNRYARIDIATGTFVDVNFAGPGGGPADVAYDQFGGDEYLIGFGGGRIYRYNITDETKDRVSIPGMPGGSFGATWTDSTGRLFTFNNNNGLLYEVTDYYTNAPTFTQVGVGVPSGNNDGFSCSLAPFPNLPPLAFDDDYSTPVNTPISDNVVTNNDNGIDNDPEGQPITVNTTPVSGPSNGMVTLDANGNFTYTPDPNFFGFDVFQYEISDPSGLTATATVTIEVIANPDYTVTKQQVAGPSPVTSASDVIAYEIVVVNTGDVPLTSVVATDTLPNGSIVTLSGQTESGAASNTPGQLDLGETWTYTTSYSVTQDDIDAGSTLINDVRVTTDETGVTSKSDTAATPVSQSPGFTLDKSVDVGNLNAPGTLTFTITVDNTGNQSLSGVLLTDTLTQNGGALTLTSGPTLAGDTDGDSEIDVDEVWTYTATFVATQAQIDDGSDIINSVEVDTDQTGSQTDDATTTITQSPSFDVSKTSNSMSISAPGVIAYEIEVTNTGNTAVTGLVPTDTLTQGATTLSLTTGLDLSGDTDGDSELDVGETWLYTGTFAAGQDHIDDGATIVNDISIASDNAGTETSQTSTTITQTAGFSIAKSVDTAVLTAPGTLNYEIVVENTGNVSLTGTSLVDNLAQSGALTLTTGPTLSGDTDADNELDVGETWTYVASFDVLQTHIDDGADIVNTATFDTNETPSDSDGATTTINQTDAITLSKSVATGEPTSFDAEGDTIDFTFVVTNSGNTTLEAPITIDDDEIGNGLACSASDLAPGASVSCDHTWTATQADLNAGSVTNTATAEDINGNVSAPQQATVTAVQSPALSIDKQITSAVPNVFAAGTVLSYEYTVVNVGNVTLTSPITVSDNLTPNAIDTAPISCDPLPAAGLLPQGGNPVGPTNSITCTAQYTLTNNDELLGSTTNIATAATTFDGNPVVSPTGSATYPVGAVPVLDLQKSAPAGLTVGETTDTITYTYRIESMPPLSGSGAALPEIIYINDDKFASPIVCYDPAVEGSSFGPGDVHTCTAVYTVTQADLDAGEVVNEATANTTFAPSSPSPIDVVSNVDTETVPVDAMPALTVVKTVTGGPNPAAVGDSISYQIVATNTGNQSLTNVAISDPQLGGLTCDIAPPVSLARTEALTCIGSYEVQQSDLDGQTVGVAATAVFTNTAMATANDPSGDAIPNAQGSVDHPLEAAAPSVSVAKALFPDPAADPAFTTVGDIVRFRITVANNGNMTLSSVDVTDSLVAGTCTVGPLAPGESDATCIFDYTVDQDDLDAGEITNVGSASAQPIDGAADPVSDTDTLVSPGPDFDGALEVIKAGTLDMGANGIADVGDVINYTITVRNSGNVTLTDIAFSDPSATSILYPSGDLDADNDIDILAPNAIETVTATRLLVQADIDAGQFANSATATGLDPANASVSDTSDSSNAADGPNDDDPTVTPIPRTSGLSIIKSFTAPNGTGAGDSISYSYLVTNTGNVTLTSVTLDDQHSSASGTAALTISNGGIIASLAPGTSSTLTATYVVTQEDVDAGNNLTNIVSAVATPPSGVASPLASDNETVAVEAANPELEAIKTVRSQSGNAAGDTIVFEIAIENTGNVSLSNIALTDTLTRVDNTAIVPAPTPVFESGDGGTATLIDVGETWIYTATYQLTQEDVDAGGIRNSVLAEANAPDGADVS